MRSRLLLTATAFAAVASAATPGSASSPREATYVAGGTAVVKQAGAAPAADAGALVCRAGGGTAVGGGCVAFPPAGGSVSVWDARFGRDVPFQACADNDGDGFCTSPDFGTCADVVVFSHDDNGAHHNPLGGVPAGFAPGCPGGRWRGLVVFLCNGVHDARGAHAHPATTGSILAEERPGTGPGTFCGGARSNPSSKAYVVAP